MELEAKMWAISKLAIEARDTFSADSHTRAGARTLYTHITNLSDKSMCVGHRRNVGGEFEPEHPPQVMPRCENSV